MREHVFSEVDKDKDFLISMDEFITGTQGDNYEKDEGWKGIDEEEVCPVLLRVYACLTLIFPLSIHFVFILGPSL